MSSEHETDAPESREWSTRQTAHHPVLPAQQARQGATGHNARYVLSFGLAGIVIVFLAIWLIYFA
ncbi:MAG: hypothetical protein WBF58_15935 [Xanthobacteraceae bacterium]